MNRMKFRDPVKKITYLVDVSQSYHSQGVKVSPSEAYVIAAHKGLVRCNRKSRGKGRKARVG